MFHRQRRAVLAVLEEPIITGCAALAHVAASFDEPMQRLHFYVTDANSVSDNGGWPFNGGSAIGTSVTELVDNG